MNRYKLIGPLGEQSQYQLFKAQNIETNQIVCIKQYKQKYFSWQEVMQLKEIKLMRVFVNENVIKILEIIKNDNYLYLVMEYYEMNLYQFIQNYRLANCHIPEQTIKIIMVQIIKAVNSMHQTGFYHRDLNLESVFLQEPIVKLGNLHNVKEINARPPNTDYVCTRWYRSPEQLLRQTNYNQKVDVFQLGCIFAELYYLQPIFKSNSEQDQLNKIHFTLGSPSQKDWPEFAALCQKMSMQIIEQKENKLKKIIPQASNQALDILNKMLTLNPLKRCSCSEILAHPFFVEE